MAGDDPAHSPLPPGPLPPAADLLADHLTALHVGSDLHMCAVPAVLCRDSHAVPFSSRWHAVMRTLMGTGRRDASVGACVPLSLAVPATRVIDSSQRLAADVHALTVSPTGAFECKSPQHNHQLRSRVFGVGD
jgi:hypothetical protein